MTFRAVVRPFFSLLSLLVFCALLPAQSSSAPAASPSADLEMVVMLSRHGVRSPLGSLDVYNRYSAAPWPKWDVPPGIQTDHGNELIKLFGEWDRRRFSSEGLLTPTGCADAEHVTIFADTDQRTRETGRELAEGMFPGCSIPVHTGSEGKGEPIFRPTVAGVSRIDPNLAFAAISGRIGGSPNNLTEAYRPQLAALDRVLAGCGHGADNPKRISILDIPSSMRPGSGDPPVEARGPLVVAATMVENLLLEYTQGMSDADVGWGCVDGATLRYLMQLDSAQWDYGYRTPMIARANASNLLDHLLKTMQQNVSGKPVAGAVGNVGDRLVILAGHDSNIVSVAASLGINWVLDGRVDDTPPGGALLFELWRSRVDGNLFVRLEYTAQTLEQMRRSEPLTPANPPGIAPVFVPGCSGADGSCTWQGFSTAVRNAIEPSDVSPQF
jgi:4-phytase / acid phosphatase